MKTKLEIIEETVKYYSEDTSRRAVTRGKCKYFADGRMCAVGRCLVDAQEFQNALKGVRIKKTGIKVLGTSARFSENDLKEEYRGHEDDFWDELQRLHDNPGMWIINGLSQGGFHFVTKLKAKYS